MRRILTATITALMLLLAVGIPAAAIIGGEPDGDRHPYVGMVWGSAGAGEYAWACSGTLIAPTVFLTAGHCTQLAEEVDAPVYVTFDSTSDFDPDEGVRAASVHTHPDICIACSKKLGLPHLVTYDVGVVILAEPVTDVGFGVLPEAGVVDALVKQARLTTVGYGIRDFEHGGGPPQGVGLGERYFAHVRYVNVTNRIGEMFIKHSANTSQGTGGTCNGDSGGPVFLPDQETVVGITSFGAQAAGQCTSISYAQRVDLLKVLVWLGGFLD